MHLVTAQQMREMDRRTIEGGLAPAATLMERAGRGLLRSLLHHVPRFRGRQVWIVCGKGNNGGDGIVLARLLRERGLWPRVLLTEKASSMTGDLTNVVSQARQAGLWLEEVSLEEARTLRRLSADDVLVDALLGTGLKGPAQGTSQGWIRAMNECPAVVMAVDIPSGLFADHSRVEGEAVHAAWTVTMAFPKLGFLHPPARERVGPVEVIDIGIPEAVRREVGSTAVLPEVTEVASWLPNPGPGSHKGDWGKILVVGGSPGLTGAPALAARAALRTGAGVVRIGIPRSLNPILETLVVEAMTIPLSEGEDAQLLASSADRILSGFGDWDALVVGPGLGLSPEAERLVMKLLGGWRGPLLIDADGLSALAKWGPDSWVPRAREIRAGGRRGGLVLTPHRGEMSRLTGRPIGSWTEDPVERAREWAVRWQVTLVLKGAPSVISSPEGEVWVNPTGNSGLSTGGSGDVLSGVIGALLGQGLDGPRSAVLGCFLHGLAADLAVSTGPGAQRSLIPGDVVEWLPRALAAVERREAPPFWRWRRIE